MRSDPNANFAEGGLETHVSDEFQFRARSNLGAATVRLQGSAFALQTIQIIAP